MPCVVVDARSSTAPHPNAFDNGLTVSHTNGRKDGWNADRVVGCTPLYRHTERVSVPGIVSVRSIQLGMENRCVEAEARNGGPVGETANTWPGWMSKSVCVTTSTITICLVGRIAFHVSARWFDPNRRDDTRYVRHGGTLANDVVDAVGEVVEDDVDEEGGAAARSKTTFRSEGTAMTRHHGKQSSSGTPVIHWIGSGVHSSPVRVTVSIHTVDSICHARDTHTTVCGNVHHCREAISDGTGMATCGVAAEKVWYVGLGTDVAANTRPDSSSTVVEGGGARKNSCSCGAE